MLGWNFKAGNEAHFRSACDVETARLTRLQLEESSVTAGDSAARDSPHPGTLHQPAAACSSLLPAPVFAVILQEVKYIWEFGGAACLHGTG